MTNDAAATIADAAAARKALCIDPPSAETSWSLQDPRRHAMAERTYFAPDFPYGKGKSACVLFDRDAVVHFVDSEDLRLPAVATKFVILAHDERLDRLCRADLRAESAKAAAREVEVEIVEHLDFRPSLAVTS